MNKLGFQSWLAPIRFKLLNYHLQGAGSQSDRFGEVIAASSNCKNNTCLRVLTLDGFDARAQSRSDSAGVTAPRKIYANSKNRLSMTACGSG